jgi:hypothetical protein
MRQKPSATEGKKDGVRRERRVMVHPVVGNMKKTQGTSWNFCFRIENDVKNNKNRLKYEKII